MKLRKLSTKKDYSDVFELAASPKKSALSGKVLPGLDAAKMAGFAMQLLNGLELTHGEASHVVSLIDVDGNGVATKKDFSQFMRMKKADARSYLRRRYRELSGNISRVSVIRGEDAAERARRTGLRVEAGPVWTARTSTHGGQSEGKDADSDQENDNGVLTNIVAGDERVITGIVTEYNIEKSGANR